MDYIIRNMKKADIKQVQNVARNSWQATYEGIIPSEIQENFLNMAYSDDMMKKRLNQSIMYVAERENQIVGFANFSNVNEKGQVELSAIYLNPSDQGKGIGSALLKMGMDSLNTIQEVYIDVESDNKIGKTFYEAKGFKLIKEYDDNFDGHTLKTSRMVLSVKS